MANLIELGAQARGLVGVKDHGECLERALDNISNSNPVSILHNQGSTGLHVPKVVRLK